MFKFMLNINGSFCNSFAIAKLFVIFTAENSSKQ